MNSSVVAKFWPNEDPIGKQIRQGFPAEPFGPWRTIVGIVSDIKQNGVDQEMPRQVFLPIVALVTLLACYLPARSASRLDPLKALRVE